MIDYLDKKFNKLTILKDAGRDKYSHKLVDIIYNEENEE